MSAPRADPLSDTLRRMLEGIRANFDPDYEFETVRPVPWTLPGASAESRVALVTTGGLHLRDDPPFTAGEDPAGDPSYRVVPQGAPAADLALDASYVDRRYTRDDPEVALPRKALAELAKAGRVGAAADRHFSFCAGVLRPRPGLFGSAARLVAELHADSVSAVVLLPTCSICVQSTCLLAGEVERAGIPTVCLSLIPELSRIVGAPRTLSVRFPFGAPAGDPRHGALHRAVLEEGLSLLARCTEPGEVHASRCEWRRPPPAPG